MERYTLPEPRVFPAEGKDIIITILLTSRTIRVFHAEGGVKFDSTGQLLAAGGSSTTIPAGEVATSPGPTSSLSTALIQTNSPSATSSASVSNEEIQTTPSPRGSSLPTPTTAILVGGGKKGLSDGAAAGIGVGCLIAGALIAGLIFWFCCGKRRRSRARDYEASSTALVPREKGFHAQATSVGSGSPGVSPISGALPLPLEDKAITGEVSKISNSIKNHIQSYYHTGRVSSGALDLDEIQAIGDDMPISAGTLSTLLGNTGTREIALRFCIAWVVCNRLQTSANPSMSFLPAELATLSRNIETTRPSSSAALQWRVMTAQLMQSSYVRDPFSASDSRNDSIQTALAALENILQPYADSRMDNQERRRNLEQILKRSALFAFTLFSQPSEFEFDWKGAQNVKSGELCIFPALVQVSDEAGQLVAPPRPFSEVVVRRLEA
ncbi:hypothetical protein BKA63DRAFT_535217 [Paraphoma chrysanthemicola]|nr:hypothetical protein BKA63DRAFT_535217 [Paraphoma chrysanthemicola]